MFTLPVQHIRTRNNRNSYISKWDLSMSVIIWVPKGGARGRPYNYTRQQIPCAHVVTLQLTCIPVVLTSKAQCLGIVGA